MMRYILITAIFFLVITIDTFSDIFWANKVIGFSSQTSNKEYSANQILGEPNVIPGFGNSACAWMPKYPTQKIEWIRLAFPERIYLKQIAINENLYSGAISKVIVYDSLGNGINVYANNEILKKESKDILRIFPENLKFRTNELRIEINTASFIDYYQIDAVAISNSSNPISIQINENVDENIRAVKENLGTNINSQFRELAPIISADGRTLYFTREGHPQNIGIFRRQDVWYSQMDENGNFKEAINLGPPINNENVNFAISLSTDGNRLLLGNIYLPNGEIKNGFSFSTFDGEKWSFPEGIKIENYYNLYERGSFHLSANGKVFLMAVKREDSYGNTDIYVSFLKDNGEWTEPKNLGPIINTADEEISPFLASDNVTLYFSTSGYPGYGQSDMFMSKRLDDTWLNWSKPVNLGKSINTSGWDAYYSITALGDYAYFVSSENSYGFEDIFRVKLPEKVKPESIVLVKGKVINGKTGKPLQANIKFAILPDGREIGTAISNKLNGDYSIALPGGKKYEFRAESDGYIAISEFIDLQNLEESATKNVNLTLYPIETGIQYRINNIFFETGKWELLEDSFVELRRLVDFLKNNQNYKIKIYGHTDDVGTNQFNLNLSIKRAESVKNFLIENGIENNRIFIKGYGKTKPIVSNNTEEGRQKNRRVEFELINR